MYNMKIKFFSAHPTNPIRQKFFNILLAAVLAAFALPGCTKQIEDPYIEIELTTKAVPSAEDAPTTETEPLSHTETTTGVEPSTEAELTATAEPALTINDVVFIGDSRTLSMASGGSLEYYLLPDSAVFATWGGELTQVSARENALAAGAAGRKLAVFWYGINDVQSDPNQKNASQFRANYAAIIDLYRSTAPDSDIVILSILSTSEKEKDYYNGQEENIRTYNAELADLCASEGYTYLDITDLFTCDECLAPGDFIHFSKEWYEENFLPTVFRTLGIGS